MIIPRLFAIDSNQAYTFADYFELNAEPEEILAYFDYGYAAQALALPRAQREFDRLENLRSRLEESLP